MSDYVDLPALGQVLLASLLAGAGLVAVFSLGLVGLSRHVGQVGSPDGTPRRSGSPAGLALAVACFAVVVGGVLLGLWTVVAG